jgi:hypothetical protein
VDIQQPPDFSVEIHLASLDARSKERTWTYIENRPGQPQTVRLDEPADTNAITYFHLCHGLLIPDNVSVSKQQLSTCGPSRAKNFLR